MSRRGRKMPQESDSPTLEKVLAALGRFSPGVHRLGEPALLWDVSWPASLAATYRRFDGAEMFHETLILWPVRQVRSYQGRYRVGEISGDALEVDTRGRVWRLDEDANEWLAEGSAWDRWLLGAIEAEAMLYERDGEFLDGLFDNSGELLPEVSERMYRRVLKRDRDAPAPRWRMALAMLHQDKVDAARQQLEHVVAHCPSLVWAWFDLARISERLGDFATAAEEVRAAAKARPDYEHAGFFWAHAARLAAACGDDNQRAACAQRVVDCDPGFLAAQREGAAASLEAGDVDTALALAELAAALAPRDVVICDLLLRVRKRLHNPSAPFQR